VTDVPESIDADIAAAERRLTAELRERTGLDDISVKVDRNPLRPDQFAVTVADPHQDDFHTGRAEVPGAIVEWDQRGPLTDEQAAEFANVIEAMRASYRPGVPDDVVPEQGREVNDGEHPDKLAAAGIIADARHREPEPEAEQVAVTYTAACRPCIDVAADVGAQHLASVPFATAHDRDTWAGGHARLTGHTVTLAVQGPTGSTITGRMTPDQQVMGPPLVAFVVRHGAEPDLLCRIPERAGAAWLMSAAYAVMLGHGGTSLGVPAAHRVMYVGRTSLPDEQPDTSGVINLHVRVDGVLGATGPEFAQPVGRTYYVDQRLDPATAEDVIETMITRETGLGRHLFGIILVADTAPVPPADEHADRILREQRRTERVDQAVATGRATPPEGALLGIPQPGEVTHEHGQHTAHTHPGADYAEHQQPIDDERFPGVNTMGAD
jgi:hypothetical protein